MPDSGSKRAAGWPAWALAAIQLMCVLSALVLADIWLVSRQQPRDMLPLDGRAAAVALENVHELEH
ncbi:MAG TPA: hypothetical protein VFT99_15565, partial [Roseiflexaceae bacterium]|nr:hypothetical protein [Roseiflexaceae bacterium]